MQYCIQNIGVLPVPYDVAAPGMLLYFNCNDIDSAELFNPSSVNFFRRILCYHKITLQPIGGPLVFCTLSVGICIPPGSSLGRSCKTFLRGFQTTAFEEKLVLYTERLSSNLFAQRIQSIGFCLPLSYLFFNRSTRKLSQYWQRMLLKILKELQLY